MAHPNYQATPALQFAETRILNPPEGTQYEHHVGSWACTMLGQVFNGPGWIITPEKTNPTSGKKPDLMVEHIIPASPGRSAESRIHLLMELKSAQPEIRFEEALARQSRFLGLGRSRPHLHHRHRSP